VQPKPVRKNNGPRIGIFGGTFNPIHFGHLGSIENNLTALNLAQIKIVPAFKNPLRDPIAAPTPQARLDMIRIGLQTLSPHLDKIEVNEIEINRKGPSYTVDTLQEFRKENKDADFFLIVGADQFEAFDKWKDYKKILTLANLVVTTRPGYVLPLDKSELPAWAQKLAKTLKNETVKLKSGHEIKFVKLQDIEASSTDIRRKLRRRDNVAGAVPTAVAEYTYANKTYDAPENKISDYTEFTKFCANVLNDKGAIAVNCYDLRKKIQPAEFSIVASGTSTRHTKALCDYVVQEAKAQFDIYPQSTEGAQEGRWVIVDFGPVMVHVFYDFVRNEYRIEDLWAGAPRI
jgi:nicotinate-nucleotide adenylyltransferase